MTETARFTEEDLKLALDQIQRTKARQHEAWLDSVCEEVRRRVKRDGVKTTPTCFGFAEAARQLRVTVAELRDMVARHTILTAKVGRAVMIPQSELSRLLVPAMLATPRGRARVLRGAR